MKLYNDDCMNILPTIADKSIDMILCDLPYGTTQCKWDIVIPVEKLWYEYRRIIKNEGVVLLFGTPPFTAAIASFGNDLFKYSWYWKKQHTGQLNAKRMPLKNVEEIMVFYKKQPTYNPQFTFDKPYIITRAKYKGSEAYGKQRDHTTTSDGRRYPLQILEFNHDKNRVHPTQKPLALCEYLVNTYTNEGDVVLDNCMGSGTTGVACKNLNRNFIGIELDKKYFDIAKERIDVA